MIEDKTVSLNEIYAADELFYYCNACGDINIPGEEDPAKMYAHKPEELPMTALNLYENYWQEGAGLPMYVVEYKGQIGMAVTALFDRSYHDDLFKEKGIGVTKSEFFAAMKRVAKMYRNAFRYETMVGVDTDPDGHEIVFFIPEHLASNAAGFASFVGDHIYKDFEHECYALWKKRQKKGEESKK